MTRVQRVFGALWALTALAGGCGDDQDKASSEAATSGASGAASATATTSGATTAGATTAGEGSTSSTTAETAQGSGSETSDCEGAECPLWPSYPPPSCEDGRACPDPRYTCATDPKSEERVCLVEFEWDLHGCETFMPACPSGYKCILDLYSSYSMCTPEIEAALDPEAPCSVGLPVYHVEGAPLAGPDDCASGVQCLSDRCVTHCVGEMDEPVCPLPGHYCWQGRIANFCWAPCDPLAPDACAVDEVCVSGSGQAFTCVTDASGEAGHYGDSCEYVNSCDPGLACLSAEYVPGCVGSGCCSPYCSLADPQCPDPKMACIPWFEEEVPVGYEDLGVCGAAP